MYNVHPQVVFIFGCLFKENNKNKVSACFFKKPNNYLVTLSPLKQEEGRRLLPNSFLILFAATSKLQKIEQLHLGPVTNSFMDLYVLHKQS
jgi:hypothetical protein